MPQWLYYNVAQEDKFTFFDGSRKRTFISPWQESQYSTYKTYKQNKCCALELLVKVEDFSADFVKSGEVRVLTFESIEMGEAFNKNDTLRGGKRS